MRSSHRRRIPDSGRRSTTTNTGRRRRAADPRTVVEPAQLRPRTQPSPTDSAPVVGVGNQPGGRRTTVSTLACERVLVEAAITPVIARAQDPVLTPAAVRRSRPAEQPAEVVPAITVRTFDTDPHSRRITHAVTKRKGPRRGALPIASLATWPSRESRRAATAWWPTTGGSPSAKPGRRHRRCRSRRAP